MLQINRKPANPMNGVPKRPAGEPKPMLEEDIAPVLARLDAWYAAHLPPDKYVFNPPATDAQLDAFEEVVASRCRAHTANFTSGMMARMTTAWATSTDFRYCR
jgi:hypothetical protein